jgi:hypothetical protein
MKQLSLISAFFRNKMYHVTTSPIRNIQCPEGYIYLSIKSVFLYKPKGEIFFLINIVRYISQYCMNQLKLRTVTNLINHIGNTNRRNGLIRTPGYTRGGIRCLERVSILCLPATPVVSTIVRSGKRNNPQS